MKPTPEAELLVARAMLAALKREGTDPQAIAFWELAVEDCEAELVRKKQVEKPEG
jgi:hypothetical protein